MKIRTVGLSISLCCVAIACHDGERDSSSKEAKSAPILAKIASSSAEELRLLDSELEGLKSDYETIKGKLDHGSDTGTFLLEDRQRWEKSRLGLEQKILKLLVAAEDGSRREQLKGKMDTLSSLEQNFGERVSRLTLDKVLAVHEPSAPLSVPTSPDPAHPPAPEAPPVLAAPVPVPVPASPSKEQAEKSPPVLAKSEGQGHASPEVVPEPPPFEAPPLDAPPLDAPPFDAPPMDAPSDAPFAAPPLAAPIIAEPTLEEKIAGLQGQLTKFKARKEALETAAKADESRALDEKVRMKAAIALDKVEKDIEKAQSNLKKLERELLLKNAKETKLATEIKRDTEEDADSEEKKAARAKALWEEFEEVDDPEVVLAGTVDMRYFNGLEVGILVTPPMNVSIELRRMDNTLTVLSGQLARLIGILDLKDGKEFEKENINRFKRAIFQGVPAATHPEAKKLIEELLENYHKLLKIKSYYSAKFEAVKEKKKRGEVKKKNENKINRNLWTRFWKVQPKSVAFLKAEFTVLNTLRLKDRVAYLVDSRGRIGKILGELKKYPVWKKGRPLFMELEEGCVDAFDRDTCKGSHIHLSKMREFEHFLTELFKVNQIDAQWLADFGHFVKALKIDNTYYNDWLSARNQEAELEDNEGLLTLLDREKQVRSKIVADVKKEPFDEIHGLEDFVVDPDMAQFITQLTTGMEDLNKDLGQLLSSFSNKTVQKCLVH